MFKAKLCEQQPVAYHVLKNALMYDKLAHAYLFSGPNGTPKKEAAYLLAQSIICKQHDFACETCVTCERVMKNEYADLIYIDGTQTSIKKESIMKLQENFQKTALEKQGHKLYIIDHIENATSEALNCLLKFLEEPTAKLTAILITEQIERVMQTIVSRCQTIVFKPLSMDQCYQCVKEEMDELDAYLLSRMIRNEQAIREAYESDDYQHARYVWRNVLSDIITQPNRALLFLQLEGFPAKQKQYGKVCFTYFIDLMNIFLCDCMNQRNHVNEWYDQKVKETRLTQSLLISFLQILMQTKDKLIRSSTNLQLLIDRMVYQMKEVN